MRRAVLASIAAVFGPDMLPPMLTLDDESGQEEEEEEATPVPPEADQSEPEQVQDSDVWGYWPGSTVVVSPPPEENTTHPASNILFSHSSPQSSSGAALDPTSPAFVPSFLLDNMRPFPPGPSGSHSQAEGPADHSRAVDDGPSAGEEYLWNVEDMMREWEERQRNYEVTSAPASLMAAPEASMSPDAAQVESEPQAAQAVQETDPPFMTDGRGRVVWSSTTSTSSRAREGRRGRATSSSAIIVPHTKSTPDLSAAEESADEASQREHPGRGDRSSSSSRLVRQRSLPLVGHGFGVENGRAAEFVTDGRGRVVFASSSH
ncbi:hypothetical protein L227DRAFT_330586 [Lentinus tigrinus ALCF2SS1-6]|uniref:Uncharacterized protein n=1 Tax=Lentinus tigrinus ALCF2SS1-6 TaxID=1328759 RepID=A0A5C2SKW0_9APHY|nr:hypothetical protein L227DRAFT_330586 [Lentinus tigrinus ALCF2SS1-6]